MTPTMGNIDLLNLTTTMKLGYQLRWLTLRLSLAQEVMVECWVTRNECLRSPRVGIPESGLAEGPSSQPSPAAHSASVSSCTHGRSPGWGLEVGGTEERPPYPSPLRTTWWVWSRKQGLLRTVELSWKPVTAETICLSKTYFLMTFGTWRTEPPLGT
jgi:hypothetical protein